MLDHIRLSHETNSHIQADCIDWAIDLLKSKLAERGITLDVEGPAELTLQLRLGKVTPPSGIVLPRQTEAFALYRDGHELVAWGHDVAGLTYALTELADRLLDQEGELFGTLPLIEKPATRIRAVARAFVSEVEDKPWLYDRAGWIKYLDMLATNRFNRFSLNLGIAYDYPYHNNMLSDVYLHFAYPFLVELPQYPIRVEGLSDLERRQNLEALKFVGREAARRGIQFQLGLWTERYDFDDVPHTSHQIRGVSDENHRLYCRDSVAFLLREIPEITGLNFRIHVEAGVPEGDYDFWRTVFSAVAQCGRQIELNLHAKGLDEHVLGAARATGMTLVVAPKYLAEHMALPYHPSAIREREYPPTEAVSGSEQLSTGSRRFTRQSYGDYLPAERDWGVVFRIWPGTQRVLAWGDPLFAAAYGRSMSFCGADGMEWMEPMSFKGRQGSGMAGARAGLSNQRLAMFPDWQRHEYAYRLMGRLSFSPDAPPESWRRFLRSRLGAAAEACERGLAAASRILPLFTQAHGPSIANNCYWPEIYSNVSAVGEYQARPVGFDMDGPTRFGNAPSFDSQMFASPRTYVEDLLADRSTRSYTPIDVAAWMDDLAGQVETALGEIRSLPAITPATERYVIDMEILAAMARFFAQKFRSACFAEVMLATRSEQALKVALGHSRRAVSAWAIAAVTGGRNYHSDLAFGPGLHMRGNWAARLPQVEAEANALQVFLVQDASSPTYDLEQADRVIARIANQKLVTRLAGQLDAPKSFRKGQPIQIGFQTQESDAEVLLHYRHVNQGERWQHLKPETFPDGIRWTIPGSYSHSDFHIQFYLTSTDGERVQMLPGFPDTLDAAPYELIEQE
ncbi:hypothetical protein HFO04_34295 [Rhizobium laguerreae]|uniref:hypothetical protein n=1 Tax=Rhizobium laguerreae TaxID=1076926 RepID=UPI001C9045EB|nr:hypothetical protein [Rhizobium laguerreae]MBY3307788.1 hypothetical protein [Rhizobium laguerreae]